MNFFIEKKNKDRALAAIKGLAGRETVRDSYGPHFSWVTTEEFLRCVILEDALNVWRWRPEIDGDGNIEGLQFEGEKLGDDILLFRAIASFVRPGSYIEMCGEDGALWCWFFNGETCLEQPGRVVYDG